MKKQKGHLIKTVKPDSIAEEMGIEPGDRLLEINGETVEDIFDYQYMIEEEYVEVLIAKPSGEEWLLEIDKDYAEDLGVEFENGLMDDYRSCSNKCIFCFIDQMPKGMRETLYFKDDDSRLSFLQGNYVTLTNMSDKDVERVRKQVSELETVTATLAKWGINAIYNENKISGTLKGLYPEYQKIEEPNIVFGRFINDIDIRDQRKVCVIGKRIYETLFPGGEDPCGKFIEVNGIYYRVIGVSMAVGNISIQGQSETSVIIPFSTMQQNYNFGQNVQLLCYTARKGYSIGEVEKKVEQVVKKAHLIHPDDGQAVILVNAEAMFSMVDNLFSGIRILGWMVGLGTLLAGAIGVSNIMMVTVKERTTEIGIRRAIGARPNDILSQILSESMVLTILAGMAGISFAVFLLNLTEMGTSTPTSPTEFQISFWFTWVFWQLRSVRLSQCLCLRG